MNKEVKNKLIEESNELFNIDDRLDNVLDNIEFDENKNYYKKPFSIKKLLYPLITILLCIASSIATLYISKIKNTNTVHSVSVKTDPVIQEATEQLKEYCDSYTAAPSVMYRNDLFYIYLYKGEKYTDVDIVNMYFIQIDYKISDDLPVKLSLTNQNDEERIVENVVNRKVYLINDNFSITDEMYLKMYVFEENKVNITIFKNNF